MAEGTLFEQLVFKPHPIDSGQQARIDFPNGYGASVVTGAIFYTSPDCPYELAVFKGGDLCYTTPITNDVIGYLTREGVESTLKAIAALPKEDPDA
jgi:hypothetical protein